MMSLSKGQMYQVRSDHKFHPGKVGKFLFMGGPDADVVVLETESTRYSSSRIGVKPEDVVEFTSAETSV